MIKTNTLLIILLTALRWQHQDEVSDEVYFSLVKKLEETDLGETDITVDELTDICASVCNDLLRVESSDMVNDTIESYS